MFRPLFACSHWSCIQCFLSCLADFLTFLQKSRYCCACFAEKFFIGFSRRFSSASSSVSSEIYFFLGVLLAGIVVSAAPLIASVTLLACSSRLHVGSMSSMFFASTTVYGCLTFSPLSWFTSTRQLCCGLLFIFLSSSLIMHSTNEWSELMSALWNVRQWMTELFHLCWMRIRSIIFLWMPSGDAQYHFRLGFCWNFVLHT